eukprot:6294006-Amphidinium_carterae.1
MRPRYKEAATRSQLEVSSKGNGVRVWNAAFVVGWPSWRAICPATRGMAPQRVHHHTERADRTQELKVGGQDLSHQRLCRLQQRGQETPKKRTKS